MPPPDSTREWYAGLAMQGLLASGPLTEISERAAEKLAKFSFAIADKMIEQGAVPPPPPPP